MLTSPAGSRLTRHWWLQVTCVGCVHRHAHSLMCTHVYMCWCACVHTRGCTQKYAFWLCTHAHMCMCVCWTCVHMWDGCVFMQVHGWVHVCTCVFACVHACALCVCAHAPVSASTFRRAFISGVASVWSQQALGRWLWAPGVFPGSRLVLDSHQGALQIPRRESRPAFTAGLGTSTDRWAHSRAVRGQPSPQGRKKNESGLTARHTFTSDCHTAQIGQ